MFTIHHREPVFQDDGVYIATLLENPEERARTYRAEAIVTAAGRGDSLEKYRERLIIYFAKHDSINLPGTGDQIIFSKTPSLFVNDGNPYAFDYKGYMLRRGIYRQVWLPYDTWVNAGTDKAFRLRVLSEKVRERLLSIYQKNGLKDEQLAILSALTLGYKKSLDQDVRQTFANSGAMHVLAVSGLHVGIVFMAFRLAFSFLKRNRTGRFVFALSAIALLWSYAFITGLSPSVMRAALMFSLVQAGDSMRRPYNIYNTLAASAFILLTIRPMLIFEVGFQLSYSAVFGIVYFQPKLSAFMEFRSRLVKYICGLLTVSVAAQLGTFAVSSFYFNQFPVWFWLTNLVVIPAALVLILLAAGILLFSAWPAVSSVVALIAGKTVGATYGFLQTVESLPGAVWQNFIFNGASLWLSLLTIFMVVLFIESRRKQFLFFSMVLMIGFITNGAVTRVLQNNRKKVIVYQHNRPLVHVIDGRRNYLVVHPSDAAEVLTIWAVKNVRTALRLQSPVIIKNDTDYEDNRLIIKEGYLFFEDKSIDLHAKRNDTASAFYPDIVIDFYGNLQPDQVFPGSRLITRFPREPFAQRIHSLSADGAFSLRL
jgi:competence protein ComEC